MKTKKIGFIGSGNIATAIINGILKSKLIKERNINIFDTDSKKTQAFSEKGLTITTSASEAAKNSDYLFLTVKPQIYEDVLSAMEIPDETILITVAPGITINFIKKLTGEKRKVIRTMPNTPALVGEGVTAYTFSEELNDEEKFFAKELLNAFSESFYMTEDKLDAIISVSGSSPAYTYMFIDAIAKSGKKQGIDYNTALIMAAKTVLGSAKLLLESDEEPQILIERVCSKGGTTIEAVNYLNDNNFSSIIDSAMQKCTKRALEMKK